MALSVRSRQNRAAGTRTQKRNFSSSRASRSESTRTPLSGVPTTTGEITALPASVSVAKASNGVTVVTYDTPSPVSSMSLFVNAGSRFEDSKNSGAAHFLSRYAWKTSIRKHALQLVRDMEVRGNKMSTKHTRENIVSTVEGVRETEFQENLAETLGAIAEPLIEEYSVDRLREEIAVDVARAAQCGFTSLTEAVHREAFRDQQLGNSLWTPEWNIDHVSDNALRRFSNTYFTRDRFTVVAVGIEPATALKLVEEYLSKTDLDSHIKERMGAQYVDVVLEALKMKDPIVNAVAPTYVGGESRTANAGATKIAIALPGVGANKGMHPTLVAGTVQTLLGGGQNGAYNFTPGQGRQSRLGANIVGKLDFVQKAKAFNFTYTDGGLFGVYASAKRGHAGQLFDALRKEVEGIATVTDAEVARAKVQLKVKIAASAAESRQSLSEFLARQVQSGSQTVLTPAQVIEQVDKVTTADVVAFAKQALASKPTVASAGDIAGISKL